jgi:hypothetical protein
MTQLEEQIDTWQEYLVPAAHSVYDGDIYDSDVEKRFIEGLEKRKVSLFFTSFGRQKIQCILMSYEQMSADKYYAEKATFNTRLVSIIRL